MNLRQLTKLTLSIWMTCAFSIHGNAAEAPVPARPGTVFTFRPNPASHQFDVNREAASFIKTQGRWNSTEVIYRIEGNANIHSHLASLASEYDQSASYLEKPFSNLGTRHTEKDFRLARNFRETANALRQQMARIAGNRSINQLDFVTRVTSGTHPGQYASRAILATGGRLLEIRSTAGSAPTRSMHLGTYYGSAPRIVPTVLRTKGNLRGGLIGTGAVIVVGGVGGVLFERSQRASEKRDATGGMRTIELGNW